jgi:SAM-dependent methyltransferase
MRDDTPMCPVCGGTSPFLFLERAAVAVHQNLLMRDAPSARQIARGRLAMHCCPDCGFIYNAAFDPARLSYGRDYDNTQTYSPVFETYVDALVDHLVHERNVRDCRVVEVGCGKGVFLRKLVELPDARNTGVGFDPAYVGLEIALEGRLRFERRCYDEAAADTPADVVICRHMIEHVERPVELLRSVRRALGESSQARVFFETPCVKWILEHRVIWDFFYEHCSLFTAESLSSAFEAAGFSVDAVRHVFGEQYLWLEARPANRPVARSVNAVDSPALARRFAQTEADCRAAWERQMRRLAGAGPVALWGAGAKGVTFANLIDPDATLIDCIVDVNPAKQGLFLPGTGHAIVAPRTLGERGVGVAVVLNPYYHAEIEQMISQLGLKTEVIDLM